MWPVVTVLANVECSPHSDVGSGHGQDVRRVASSGPIPRCCLVPPFLPPLALCEVERLIRRRQVRDTAEVKLEDTVDGGHSFRCGMSQDELRCMRRERPNLDWYSNFYRKASYPIRGWSTIVAAGYKRYLNWRAPVQNGYASRFYPVIEARGEPRNRACWA